jgi:hypothetical protein
MKQFIFFLFHLIVYTNFYDVVHAAGFAADTLVHTINQQVPIAHLKELGCVRLEGKIIKQLTEISLI